MRQELFCLSFRVFGFFPLRLFQDFAQIINRRTIVKVTGIKDGRQPLRPVNENLLICVPFPALIFRGLGFFLCMNRQNKPGHIWEAARAGEIITAGVEMI